MDRPARTLLLAAVALSLAQGCSHAPPIDQRADLDGVPGRFELHYARVDEGPAHAISRAIEDAAPRLAMWGPLEQPIVVTIEPSHAALERAVDRSGYGWLRAWARYREVWVQSPRTWGLWGGDQEAIDELLTHELTHCVMYQLAASEADWSYKGIPLWFREGMASVTARQGYRRGTLEELAEFYRAHPEDPVADGEALYQRQSEVVYNAAHQAFRYLLDRHGVDGVKRLLAAMKGGLSFDAAFAETLGTGRRDFEREFAGYVRTGGFRHDGSAGP